MNDRLMKTEEEVRQRAKELLQLRPEDLLTQYMFQEQEIERLNKELEQYKYSADELNEIERLNNIINELEKDLEDRYYGRGKYCMDTYSIGIKDILDKLQELKRK